MADETAAKGGGGLPAAIERTRLVRLPVCGQTIEVRRWSYARLMQVSQFLTQSYDGIEEEDVEAALKAFYAVGHTRFLEVAKLSVAEEHRALINDEMDATDVFAVMEAAFALNGEGNLKKAGALAGQFLLGQMRARPPKDGEKKEPPKSPEKDSPDQPAKKS